MGFCTAIVSLRMCVYYTQRKHGGYITMRGDGLQDRNLEQKMCHFGTVTKNNNYGVCVVG